MVAGGRQDLFLTHNNLNPHTHSRPASLEAAGFFLTAGPGESRRFGDARFNYHVLGCVLEYVRGYGQETGFSRWICVPLLKLPSS
jgi:hypothetical protein